MKLRRFELEGYAQSKHLSISFREGVPNLVLEPNETAKSHLRQALYGTLFGLDQPDQFKPWFGESSAMRGILEFDEDEGRQVRLERNFEPNAVIVAVEGERPWMVRTGPRARMAESERYAACLERWLGVCDADIFTAATLVHQADVARASVHGLAPQLKRLITGSTQTDFEHALDALRQQLDALRQPPGRTSPRLQERKEQELLELEQTFGDAQRLQVKVSSLQERHERLNQAIQSREEALVQKRPQLEQVRGVVERERELVALEIEFEGLTTRMNQFVAAHERIERARIVREKVSAAEGVDLVTVLELEHAVRLAHQRCEIAKEQAAKMPAWVNLGTWIIAVIGALIGTALAVLVNWILLALLLIVGGVVAWRVGIFSGEKPERRTPTVVKAEQELEDARARREEVLQRLGVSTVEETLTLRKTYEFSDRALEKAQAALLALGDEKQISERYQQVSVRLTSMRYRMEDTLRRDENLRALGSLENRATYGESLEEQVHILERSLEDLRQERHTIERELLEAGAEQYNVPVLFREVQTTRHEVEDIRQRRHALELAIETLERSVEDFYNHCLDPVLKDASNLLDAVTGGRYTRVSMSPHDLEPRVDAPGKGSIPRSQLNRIVQEQLYFTLRVALATTLSGGRRLPLVLDDECLNLDREQLERTVTLLGSLASTMQVILFTSNPQYEEWFEPVLRPGRNGLTHGGEHRAIS